jgi:rRNA maturation endonuclease Nob1
MEFIKELKRLINEGFSYVATCMCGTIVASKTPHAHCNWCGREMEGARYFDEA